MTLPQVKRTLDRSDIRETVNVRMGFNRNQYRVTPGLYCIGTPDHTSPVLVSANYKLSFDELRKALKRNNAWILVHGVRCVRFELSGGGTQR